MIWKTHLKNKDTHVNNHQGAVATPDTQKRGGIPPTLGESHKGLSPRNVLPNKKRFVSLKRGITKKFVTKKCGVWNILQIRHHRLGSQLGSDISHQAAARRGD